MSGRKRGGKNVLIGVICGVVLLAAIAAVLFLTGTIGSSRKPEHAPRKTELTVGTDIAIGDVTEFYYTLSASTYPPHYQRYRFYRENGGAFFYHEKREGDHWPLREEDVTVSGTRELSETEWSAFFDLLREGTVKKREEHLEDGDAGPWLYLYWKEDGGERQEYSFPALQARAAFEDFCAALAEKE